MVIVSSILTLQLMYNNKNIENMYEVLEHWNQYKQEQRAKELQKKIAAKYELDKLLTKLANENGVTNY